MEQFEGVENSTLFIWRVENFQLKPIPNQDYSKFFIGDSYLLLKNIPEIRLFRIHFWIGHESSQDESGTAALMAIQLSTYLTLKGRESCHYRELQQNESLEFTSYFPNGIQYLPGGVKSGFTCVDDIPKEKRLLKVKGKRRPRVIPVEMKWQNLDQGDVFILDTHDKLILWSGPQANKYEKMKGLQVSMHIKNDERGGKSEFTHYEEALPEVQKEFWQYLGSEQPVDPSQLPNTPDQEENYQELSKQVELFHIKENEQTADLSITEIQERPLKKEILDGTDVYVLSIQNAIYVWIGHGATTNERVQGFDYAKKFIKQRNLPENTRIMKVPQNSEDSVFKSYFHQWDPPVKIDLQKQYVAKKEAEVDVQALYQPIQQEIDLLKSGEFVSLDGFYYQNHKLRNLKQNQLGQFYQDDCFLYVQTTKVNGIKQWMLYFWLGANASIEKKGSIARLTVEMDQSQFQGYATQVRVVQNKEPAHFVQLFNLWTFIVHKGGIEYAEENAKHFPKLYHIRGSNPFNTRAVEIDCKAENLNSNDNFLVFNDRVAYIWQGKGSSNAENTFAKKVAQNLCASQTKNQITEGSEPQEFWTLLGGQAEYGKVKELDFAQKEPRLFHCSNASGAFKIQEIPNFSQEDLIEDDVMLLDVYTQVFIWHGKDSQQQERELSFQAALEFNAKAIDGRDPETPIVQISSGAEPIIFTRYFPGWVKQQEFIDVYEQKLQYLSLQKQLTKEQEEMKVSEQIVEVKPQVAQEYQDPSVKSYTMQELQGQFPSEVDPAHKEVSFYSALLKRRRILESFQNEQIGVRQIERLEKEATKAAIQAILITY